MRRPFTLALLAPLALLAACEEQRPEVREVVRPVRAIKVGDVETEAERWLPGRAKATQEADVAFEVDGRIIERHVRVGDQVEKDQLLAELDSRDFENDVEAARALLDQARALFERVEQAASTGAVAQQEVTDAEAQMRVAAAELAIAEKALDDAKLLAPFAGTVVARYVERFENVQAKQPVMRILDTSSVEMVLDVPEQFMRYVPYVTGLTVRFDAFRDVLIPAEIKEVGLEASRETRTFPVTVIMDQPKGVEILPGMAGQARGDVEVPLELLEGGQAVPIEAIFTDVDGSLNVWVVDESGGSVSKREVTRGGMSSVGVFVEGVEAGEWVVTAGVNTLVEGQPVTILERETPLPEETPPPTES